MYQLLKGMRIVEGGSFIAAPSCGLHLCQLGADVIRFDMIGGGPDLHRWPQLGRESFYWEGLNKGKKSIAVNLALPEGRELVEQIITAPGAERGMFLTNFPTSSFLSYERLRRRRDDLIVLRVMGRADGTTAVDYTINCTLGVPQMTGPACLGDEPVNHVLPAWDLLTGSYAAFALLAAERHRRTTGEGQEIRVPLSDLAIASLGHLGQIAETTLSGGDRPRYGNDLFGAFGRDFVTRDSRRVMIVAITPKQWSGLVQALNVGPVIAKIESDTGISFKLDEGLRFQYRDRLNAVMADAVAGRDFDELADAFDAHGVCWGLYRTLSQALADDPDLSTQNPILSMVKHPAGHSYLTPGAAATFSGAERLLPARAPRFAEHTDEVLTEVLGLSSGQIATLHDRNIVEGPEKKS